MIRLPISFPPSNSIPSPCKTTLCSNNQSPVSFENIIFYFCALLLIPYQNINKFIHICVYKRFSVLLRLFLLRPGASFFLTGMHLQLYN